MIETVFLLIMCSGGGEARSCAPPYEFKFQKECEFVRAKYAAWAYSFDGQCIRVTRRKEAHE